MSIRHSRSVRGYARRNRRGRMALDIDLNDTPPAESRLLELDGETVIQDTGIEQPTTSRQAASSFSAIDLDAADDDVLISSPRSFAEARNKTRRNNDVTVIDDDVQHPPMVNSEDVATRLSLNNYNMRRRRSSNQSVINCDAYINLEGSNSVKRKRVVKSMEPPESVPPPKEPIFTCPVCIGPVIEETSTKCGHIFCKKCIKAALATQSKCPTCRRKLTMKDTFRIYLPSTC